MIAEVPRRNCEACGVVIKPRINANGRIDRRYSKKKYCSPKCGSAKLHEQYAAANPRLSRDSKLSSGTTGALAELLVSADLMRRGWNVFRALSQSCPCDLMITKGDTVLRVEVRTGYMGVGGKLSYPWTTKDAGRSDIVAVVHHGTMSIAYKPDLVGDSCPAELPMLQLVEAK